MSQAAREQLRPAQASVMVAEKPPPLFKAILVTPKKETRAGSVLLKGSVNLPWSIQVDPSLIAGWNVAVNKDAPALGRDLPRSGWNFFFIAPAIGSAAVGFDPNRTLVQALKGVLQQLEAKGFNAVEIVSIDTKRCLGIHRVKIRAHPRHVRRSPYIRN
jgi:hypothetical protein